MQKFKLFILGCFLFPAMYYAAPGDTTWVTVFSDRKIDHYGYFDTTAHLPAPGTSYRKIRMHYILGRYACPQGTQYCGSWDYTTMVIAQPAAADTVEIARVITPYATDWLAKNKSHDYIIDVSDYAAILHGDLDMRYKYEGYSWGFTLTLKIEYIEGTPPVEALKVSNIYDGYFTYGSTTDPIENHLQASTEQYAAPAASAKIKNTISGHGSDDTGCGEFCSKYYQMKINGSVLDQVQLWKSDCGYNNVYPQTGTWIYDRANWCPGEQVYPIYHDLSGTTSPGASFTADIDMQPYTANQANTSGGYNIVSQLVEYASPAYTLDASIEDIISPTNDPNHFRSNAICQTPIIKVKNTGTSAITSLSFTYGLVGGTSAQYTWTGNLAAFQEVNIELDGPNIFFGNESDEFYVEITDVNQQGNDEDSFNNTYKSKFKHANYYPSEFVVQFKSNNTGGSVNQTSWKIEDENGNIVAERSNNANNTTFKDTVNLAPGCYTFIMNDTGCDGFSWWAYSSYNPNPGHGTLRFNKLSGSMIKNFSGDFGCQFKERFTVGYQLGLDESGDLQKNFKLYPNPAGDKLNIQFTMTENMPVKYLVSDLTGKSLESGNKIESNSGHHSIDTAAYAEGIYMFTCYFEDGEVVQQRFVVKH